MFYGDNPADIRAHYYQSWQKYQRREPLEALEQQLVAVILDHPEYHALLSTPDVTDIAYFPELGETNPFLHMGLHIALREQITTNRPTGITPIFNTLLAQRGDRLQVEHDMIACLAECLWQAQRAQTMPDETAYLETLRELARIE